MVFSRENFTDFTLKNALSYSLSLSLSLNLNLSIYLSIYQSIYLSVYLSLPLFLYHTHTNTHTHTHTHTPVWAPVEWGQNTRGISQLGSCLQASDPAACKKVVIDVAAYLYTTSYRPHLALPHRWRTLTWCVTEGGEMKGRTFALWRLAPRLKIT